MKRTIFRTLFTIYAAVVVAIIINSMIGCSTRKTLPADFNLQKHISIHHQPVKAKRVYNCNRE